LRRRPLPLRSSDCLILGVANGFRQPTFCDADAYDRLAVGTIAALCTVVLTRLRTDPATRVYRVESMSSRPGSPEGQGCPAGCRLAEFDVGEDVGLADAGLFDGVVAAVGPDRINGPVGGGDAVVVADERPRSEEPQVRIPRPGADPTLRPAAAIVGRGRLPGVDVAVGRVAAAVEPDGVQVAVGAGVDPGEELVVVGRATTRLGAQEAGVGPVQAAVVGLLDRDVGAGGRPVDVVLVQVGQRAGPLVVVDRQRVGGPEEGGRQEVAEVGVVDELARLVDVDRAGQEAGPAVGGLLQRR
jgi:hypothetical protein